MHWRQLWENMLPEINPGVYLSEEVVRLSKFADFTRKRARIESIQFGEIENLYFTCAIYGYGMAGSGESQPLSTLSAVFRKSWLNPCHNTNYSVILKCSLKIQQKVYNRY